MESEADIQSAQEISCSSDPSDIQIAQEKYRLDWQQLTAGIEEIKRRALTGALRVSRIRSLAWAILVGVVPSEPSEWLNSVRKNRNEYCALIKKFKCDPRCCKLTDDNPLSQNDESKWNQHFRDTELQSIINMDVVRTFPGTEFFKQPDIQSAMEFPFQTNVLFCFAREKPHLLYRQGMHEILAPLLFVLQSDHRAAEHCAVDEEMLEIMDPQYLEHDSYALFKAIMFGIEKFYRINETPPLSPDLNNSENNSQVPKERKRIEVEVVTYLNDIKDNLLSKQDLELSQHLQKCDISLSLFGVRWLRVLFGREFAFHDLLVLWDAIFAENEEFSLTGYIIVAMLTAIRKPLLHKDPMVCLEFLMHYPSTVDVQYIIESALFLKHPEQYCMPAPRTFNFYIHPTLHVGYDKTVVKQKKTVHHNMTSSGIRMAESADNNVIDGIPMKEVEVLRNELCNAFEIMSLCSAKLEKYEETLRLSIPRLLPSHPAYETLNGMKEMSKLLRRKSYNPSEVEPAYEADESIVTTKGKQDVRSNKDNNSPKDTPASFLNKTTNKINANKPTAVSISSAKEVQLKVFNWKQSSESISGAPSHDPLHIHID